MYRQFLVVLALLSFVVCGHLVFATQSVPKLKIRELMTPEQFQSAGLHKLSTSELAALDKWFSDVANNLIRIETPESKKER